MQRNQLHQKGGQLQRCPPFCLCARQGAFARECKTPMTPAGGIMSRTARVSTVRWNLKEAEGETLA